ncbi:WD40-repeat-containing domain protein [Hyaloraphidium curvatum]|nr:WD40-repeat-containing domain protein [Hyaloraphidium curvatum]
MDPAGEVEEGDADMERVEETNEEHFPADEPMEASSAERDFVPPPLLDFGRFFDKQLPCYASTGSIFNDELWRTDVTVSPPKQGGDVPPRPLADVATTEGNFFKGARWSPDGSCFIASTNDNCLRVFPFPHGESVSGEPLPLGVNTLIDSAEPIYDCQFYPYFSYLDPASAVFIASSRDHPVHLWDAYTGEVRCSYQTYDHLDQVAGPNSLCFTPDGARLYCGFENRVQVFDTSRPGNEGRTIPTTPTRKSKDGQKGIISTIAFSPDRSGLWAAGSYGRSIGLYDERRKGVLYLLTGGQVDADRTRRPARTAGGRSASDRKTMGGVTQVQFSVDGWYLFSASRKDNLILCWDIRNSDEVLYALDRGSSDTNQRMAFDIDRAGQFLAAGNVDGQLAVFGLPAKSPDEGAGENQQTTEKDSSLVAAGWNLHEDTISSVSFHPTAPYLLTSSGSRRLPAVDAESSDDSDADRDPRAQPVKVDNSVRIFSLSLATANEEG